MMFLIEKSNVDACCAPTAEVLRRSASPATANACDPNGEGEGEGEGEGKGMGQGAELGIMMLERDEM
jgi:hypothetical protein